MLVIRYKVILCLWTLLTSQLVWALPSIDEAKMSRFTLDNGLQVILVKDTRAPLLTFSLLFPCGHNDSPNDKVELAHLVEHLWHRYPNRRFRDFLFQRGVRFNASTRNETTQYWFTIQSSDQVLLTEYLAERLGNQIFENLEPQDMNREISVLQNELLLTRDGADSLSPSGLSHVLGSKLYLSGTKQLASMTVEDVRRFHRHHYAPRQASLVILGDLKLTEMETKVRDSLSTEATGFLPPPAPEMAPKTQAQSDEVEWMAWELSPQTDLQERVTLRVAAALLTQPRIKEQDEFTKTFILAWLVPRRTSLTFVLCKNSSNGTEPTRSAEEILTNLSLDRESFQKAVNEVRAQLLPALDKLHGRDSLASVFNEANYYHNDPLYPYKALQHLEDLSPEIVSSTLVRHLRSDHRQATPPGEKSGP